MEWRLPAWCLLLLSFWTGPAWTQAVDSLAYYELGEIVVGPDSVASTARNTATIQRVGLAAITQSDALSIDRVLRNVPGAHLQTNSRGETLVYLRGAGERQVAVFFDGALLNIPWDNRIDLSLVPAEVIGEITVVKGPPPVVYGTNVMGGALNLTSRNLNREGGYGQFSGKVGSHGSRQTSAYYLHRRGRFGFAAHGGYASQDGMSVPSDALLPYGQENTNLRTNTDHRTISGYGHVSWHGAAGAQLGLALLTLSSEKGIAPEGHHDPQIYRVRYWRYPDWNLTTIILSGLLPIGSRGTTLRSAAWASFFGQTIDQYESVRYEVLDETQNHNDYTQGLRLSLYSPMGRGAVTSTLSMLTSLHEQTDYTVSSGEILERSFRQHVFSVGGEYSRPGRVTATLGVSLDGIATPMTGDKPPRKGEASYSVMSGFNMGTAPGMKVRVAIGRKVRFPTMRELFGEALGRFLVNSDLGPEHAILSEAGILIDRDALSLEIVGFHNRTFDTIDQRLVTVEGEDRPRRQRVNLPGSRAVGVESMFRARPFPRTQLRCNLMALRARALVTPGGSRRLTEKPDMLGRCASSYTSPGGLSLMLEYELTGRAYGLTDTGSLARLPRASVINARVGYLLVLDRWAAEAFARLNNATDTVTLPQLGLPGPGRAVQAGMQVSF